MWLECIRVVSCCNFLILLIPTPLVLLVALFFAAASLLLCSFLKCFFVLVLPKWRFFTSRGAHVNGIIIAMLYSFDWKSAVQHDGGV